MRPPRLRSMRSNRCCSPCFSRLPLETCSGLLTPPPAAGELQVPTKQVGRQWQAAVQSYELQYRANLEDRKYKSPLLGCRPPRCRPPSKPVVKPVVRVHCNPPTRASVRVCLLGEMAWEWG
jgi:hypothetical protein